MTQEYKIARAKEVLTIKSLINKAEEAERTVAAYDIALRSIVKDNSIHAKIKAKTISEFMTLTEKIYDKLEEKYYLLEEDNVMFDNHEKIQNILLNINHKYRVIRNTFIYICDQLD